jgi:hypothetical protein
MPTRQFRDRLVAMASRRGMAVCGVPAAYSSIWGKTYWRAPLSTKHHKVSGHTGAPSLAKTVRASRVSLDGNGPLCGQLLHSAEQRCRRRHFS